MTPDEFYQNESRKQIQILNHAGRQVRIFTFLRLLVFSVFAVSAYLLWGNHLFFVLCCLLGISLFLVAVHFSVDARLLLEKTKQHLLLIEQETTALENKKTPFDCGAEFIDPKHPFSTDLDLFAPHGIFSFFNRTSSYPGKKLLATSLLNGVKNPDEIRRKIEILEKNIAWTQEFRVAGSISSREKAYEKRISNFTKLDFSTTKPIFILSILIPLVSISALLAFNLDLIGGGMCMLIFSLALAPIGSELKRTNARAAIISEYEAKIVIILDQIRLIKILNSDEFSIEGTNKEENIEQELKTWLRISKRFEIRLNILLSIPMNLFFAWDFQQRLALEKWIIKNREKLELWEEKLAFTEVLISAATVRFNYREETSFATISDSSSEMNFSEVRHPLIVSSKSVPNRFHLNEPQHFIILTGPNMAGKSTFLRSIGISIVLANAGFPVFAGQLELPKVKLYSSMRTVDDLSNESSYFHAELSRLKFIKDAIDGQEQVFVLLDEILKGTNSKDKEEGSKKFLIKMKKLGAKGIIATHDLSLCELAISDPTFSNFYFDSTINQNELSFDYTMKAGICQNMNASFLLKKMDLID